MTFSTLWTTSYQVKQDHYTKYDQHILEGKYHPLTSTSFSLGLLPLLAFFLFIPPKSRFHNLFTRYAVFTAVLSWHIYLITCFQARSTVVGFGVGITSAWGTLWAATLLVFKDAKVEFKRVEQRLIERAEGQQQNGLRQDERTSANEPTTQRSPRPLRKMADESNFRQQAHIADSVGNRSLQANGSSNSNFDSEPNIDYVWQSYPVNSIAWHRLRWVADILTNFRGVGWNWRISGLPSLPLPVQRSLQRTSPSSSSNADDLKDTPKSHSGLHRYDTVDSLVRHNLLLFLRGYLLVDLLKTIANHDPYFFTGDGSLPPPAWFQTLLSTLMLPSFLTPSLTHIYRLTISMSFVWLTLRSIFTLGPLVYTGLLSRRHSCLRKTPILRSLAFFAANGEAWLYPDAFASYSSVLSRGLAGWWGAWWHQLFRFAFQSAGEFAAAVLRLDQKSVLGKAVVTMTVFVVSGLVHASGSVALATVTETRPWSGSFAFFAIQPVALLAEMVVQGWVKKSGVAEKTPKGVGMLVRFLYVHAWFYVTAGLLVDDFARGGVWTFEPIAFSLFRGLGMGVEGDGFWCIRGKVAWWHTNEKWWLSGVAL